MGVCLTLYYQVLLHKVAAARLVKDEEFVGSIIVSEQAVGEVVIP